VKRLLRFCLPTSVGIQKRARMRFPKCDLPPNRRIAARHQEGCGRFFGKNPRSPAAQLRPKFGMVGSVWLVFIGPKLQRAASGLGPTAREALECFTLRFMEPLISRNAFWRE